MIFYIWKSLLNTGVEQNLPATDIRKIRLLNGILVTGEILFLLLILKSFLAGVPQEYSVQILGAILFSIPIVFNNFKKYRLARLLCILIPVLYFSFLGIYWGSHRGSQLILLAVAGLSVLFFEKQKDIISLVFFSSFALVLVEVFNIYNDPLYSPANVEFARIINLIITILMIVTIMGIFKKENYEYQERIGNTNKKITIQHKKVLDLNRNLSHSLAVINEQKSAIDEAHERLQDSINYAKVIQQAILDVSKEVKENLPDHFILFKAKNVVSGDFYYLFAREAKTYVAIVDCTGHGVPGAFMSMIGHSLLQEAIETERMDDPGEILTFLNQKIHQTFKQSATSNNDGMDAGLIIFDKNSFELRFAGAKIPLILFNSKGYRKIKGDSYSIGGFTPANHTFTTQTVQLAPVDMLYLCTDGYQDQFGGTENKKFRSTRLIDQFFGIQNEPLEIQKQKLNYAFNKWKGSNEQTDDILILGMRV